MFVVKSFYRNQRKLAESLSRVIDGYWQSEIPENEMATNHSAYVHYLIQRNPFSFNINNDHIWNSRQKEPLTSGSLISPNIY